MKAVSVLLCLALAHGITASIFQQVRPVDDLEVLKQEYIDQYQRQHRNTPSDEYQRYPKRVQKDQLVQQKKHYQQWEQPQETQSKEQTLNSKEQYQQHHQQQPAYYYGQQQSSSSSSQQSEEQENERFPRTIHNHHHGHHHHHHNPDKHHHSDSASHESSQSSQESNERTNYYERAHYKKWNSMRADVYNQQKQEPSDAILWKTVQIAVSPKNTAVTVQDKESIEKIFTDAMNAMKHITEEDKVKFHQQYQLAQQQENNEAVLLNATQLAQQHEYPIEEHTIKTDDGYVLTLFRIPPRKLVRDVLKRQVVFLMHGIDGSADDWLLMGPGKSLAYLLSDAGYDVWLGNARGNKYSRKHVSKHPAMPDFWQFSIDEIALHDLPAMIDYTLKTTEQEKLFYIGHSQGTTAFFALTATQPEYNNKIIMMYALSPMAYMTNVRSPLFRLIAPTNKYHEQLEQQLGNGAFTPKKDVINAIGGSMLEKETGCKTVAANVNFVMAGVNVDGLDASLIPVVMRHLPAGTSTKVIKQFGQGVASHEFRRFDYGPKINVKVYGQEQPPKFEVEKIQAPVTLFYSEEDWLAHPIDVERLVKELPNVKETHKVTDEHFSNMDFQFSKKAPEMVYRQLIESMENNQ